MTDKKLILQIDFRSGLPIYIQIVNQVQAQIASGILNPGAQLPTVRALAEELRVNFNTVARAYRILDEARIISTQQGRGTFITEVPPPKVKDKLRKEALEALTQRYIDEAERLDFSKEEIATWLRNSSRIGMEQKQLKVKVKVNEYKENMTMESKLIKSITDRNKTQQAEQHISAIGGTIFGILMAIAVLGAVLMDGRVPDAWIGLFVAITTLVGVYILFAP